VSGETPSLSLISQTTLPLSSPPAFILPVDPMGWISSRGSTVMERDVLLSVGSDGKLMFWVPEGKRAGWRCTGKVRTGRTNLRMARCSSAKKTVLSESSSQSDFLGNSIVPMQSFPVSMGKKSRFGTQRSLNSHRGWSMWQLWAHLTRYTTLIGAQHPTVNPYSRSDLLIMSRFYVNSG
jgi:hypothetical protein